MTATKTLVVILYLPIWVIECNGETRYNCQWWDTLKTIFINCHINLRNWPNELIKYPRAIYQSTTCTAMSRSWVAPVSHLHLNRLSWNSAQSLSIALSVWRFIYDNRRQVWIIFIITKNYIMQCQATFRISGMGINIQTSSTNMYFIATTYPGSICIICSNQWHICVFSK